MEYIMSLIVPVLLASIAVYAICHRVDVYSGLVSGAGEGLKVVAKILPTLVCLLTAVSMLRASGAMEAFTHVLTPLFSRIGIPEETAALIFIRPISGSGALAVGSDIINRYGADSQIGRTAAVMLGSTETTFYTIAVYFGAAKIKKTRYAIPAALTADFVGFFVASLAVRLLFG